MKYYKAETIKVTIKLFSELSSKELESIRECSLRNGSMKDFIRDPGRYYADVKRTELFLKYNKGKLIGWGIVIRSTMVMTPARFWVYVDPAFRRRGLGEALYRKARESLSGMLRVYPWNDTSDAFYNSIGVSRDNWS